MYEALGEELKKLRLKSGLKQKEVSVRMGYTSSQFISNWERGISAPPVKSLKLLASIYNCSADKLFLRVQKAIMKQLRDEFDRSVAS